MSDPIDHLLETLDRVVRVHGSYAPVAAEHARREAAAVRALRERVAELEAVLRSVPDNYECDQDYDGDKDEYTHSASCLRCAVNAIFAAKASAQPGDNEQEVPHGPPVKDTQQEARAGESRPGAAPDAVSWRTIAEVQAKRADEAEATLEAVKEYAASAEQSADARGRELEAARAVLLADGKPYSGETLAEIARWKMSEVAADTREWCAALVDRYVSGGERATLARRIREGGSDV